MEQVHNDLDTIFASIIRDDAVSDEPVYCIHTCSWLLDSRSVGEQWTDSGIHSSYLWQHSLLLNVENDVIFVDLVRMSECLTLSTVPLLLLCQTRAMGFTGKLYIYIQWTSISLITSVPEDGSRDSLWHVGNLLYADIVSHPARLECIQLLWKPQML
jgi:hypothetical protein